MGTRTPTARQQAARGATPRDGGGWRCRLDRRLPPDEFPNRYHLYAWDWRKSPDAAIAELDALVEKVRPPGGKVVLMGHSMGGPSSASTSNDQARADKVSRVLTAGTPYWGSPKALFPFLYGEESPGTSSLDAIFAIDKLITYGRNDLRHFARYLQGCSSCGRRRATAVGCRSRGARARSIRTRCSTSSRSSAATARCSRPRWAARAADRRLRNQWR